MGVVSIEVRTPVYHGTRVRTMVLEYHIWYHGTRVPFGTIGTIGTYQIRTTMVRTYNVTMVCHVRTYVLHVYVQIISKTT